MKWRWVLACVDIACGILSLFCAFGIWLGSRNLSGLDIHSAYLLIGIVSIVFFLLCPGLRAYGWRQGTPFRHIIKHYASLVPAVLCGMFIFLCLGELCFF